MSKRDEGVTRRLQWISLLAAALVLGTGTAAAQAFWRAETPLSGVVSSGSFSLTASWSGSWSKTEPLFPGETSDSPTLRVTETGAAGTTLRWRLTPVVSASPHLTTQLYAGSCGSGVPIDSGSPYAPLGGYSAGETVNLCVRVTVKTDAPTTLQGAALTPTISVTAEQVVQ